MNDQEAKRLEREEIVSTLTLDDLRLLSSRQLSLCKQIELERVNKTASQRIKDVLKDQTKDIAGALTKAPFVYLSPEFQVMAGCRVRFSTLMKTQLDDAHRQLDEFISNNRPNEIRISDHLNTHLLAHSLTRYNDEEFGGVIFDAIEYQALRSTKPEDAQNILSTVRKARLSALSALSPHLHQRLVEYYQAFQMAIDEITLGDEMEGVLGN